MARRLFSSSRRHGRKRSVFGLSWGEVILYGALLAGGALVLQWMNFGRFARWQPMEMQIGLLAALFLGLGIWMGAKLFAGPASADAENETGNPNARAALGISAREYEVLFLLDEGLTNKEIARRLNVSPNTVKTHVTRLLEKLEARRRTEAISKARELGIL